ncbi:MAG: type II toxin-antitoxin system VapC family toxin [Pseudomonadota bacterium]
MVKKYFNETASDEVISLWVESEAIVVSTVAYAEAMASFYRKKREVGLSKKIFGKILESFHYDWTTFIHVHINNDLDTIIHRIISTHGLRGFDAIHLASAIVVQKEIQDSFLFVCFDRNLVKAGQAEGVKTFPPI